MEDTAQCRLCARNENLRPIFDIPDVEKTSQILFLITGVRITNDDILPKTICLPCKTFIDQSRSFRHKCLITQVILEAKNNIKEEDSNNEHKLIYPDDSETVYDDDQSYFTKEKKSVKKNKSICSGNSKNVCKKSPKNKRKLKIKVEKSNNEFKSIWSDDDMIDSNFDSNDDDMNELIDDNDDVEENNQSEQIDIEFGPPTKKKNNQKQIICQHCGKAVWKNGMMRHLRSIHGYERLDKCSYCDYKGIDKHSVKVHERIHTGERPHVCEECNAGFMRRSTYLQHIGTHLTERNFKCDRCPSQLKSKRLLELHINRHKNEEYGFKCYVCQHQFSRRRYATKHIIKIHRVTTPDVSKIVKFNKLTGEHVTRIS